MFDFRLHCILRCFEMYPVKAVLSGKGRCSSRRFRHLVHISGVKTNLQHSSTRKRSLVHPAGATTRISTGSTMIALTVTEKPRMENYICERLPPKK
jgi:hypothetical protein